MGRSYLRGGNLGLALQTFEADILRQSKLGYENHESSKAIHARLDAVHARHAGNFARFTAVNQARIFAYRDGIRAAFTSSMVWCVEHNGAWRPTKECGPEIANYPKSRFAHCYNTLQGFIPYDLEIFLELNPDK